MSEFVATLEVACGQSLKWRREEWLERQGVPLISLKSDIRRKGNRFQINVVLEQKGNLYHLPMEIGIRSIAGMRIEKLNLKKRQMSFTFESANRPTEILFDPNGWLLMKKGYIK